ncbi:hypothetical protein [Neisseria sp. HMSC077D05]|uniref:hypothetical protein n=1 Tax=Neisseria sp. HMSC077D05 TaxID=1715079 RepID=UPI0009F5E8D6|nr:hypothetical protein [Neisseria sp. HMSC077D05]
MTIIGLSAICPLSPWERVRERAKRNNLKKTSSEKDGNKKYALPKPPKEKHKKQLLPKYVSDDLSPPKSGTRRLKPNFPNTSN